ncbi:MAG: hypothetical protein WKF94_11970 [Solirubrobacteraceae bacterium]
MRLAKSRHRAAEAVELGDHERVGVTAIKEVECLLDSWALEIFGGEAGVLDDRKQRPVASGSLCLNRFQLLGQACAAVRLLLA